MVKKIEDSLIFKATIEVLLKYGYAGAKTKAIADKAGVNEVTLFRKYGSKKQLVLAAILYERKSFSEGHVKYSGDLFADLLAMVNLYSEATPRQSKLMMLIIADASRYPELHEMLNVPFSLVAHFGQIIARYQAEGKLRSEDPISVVMTLLGPVVIGTMLRNVESDLPIPRIHLPTYVQNFLQGHAVS